MTWIDEREPVEHECPQPLRARVDVFAVGGMVFTPAERWETVTEVDSTPVAAVVVVVVRTDRAVWRFWPSDKLPYLPSWEARTDPGARVIVDEGPSRIAVEVVQRNGQGHVLLTAMRGRGVGWVIQDYPDALSSEQVTVESRAKARSEIRRRARAHGKRLGLPFEPGTRANR